MIEIVACFAVTGSTARNMKIDIEGKTPDEIADLVDGEFDGVSMCHQCAPNCEDPEAELTAFTIGSTDYERADGHWIEVSR
jgi:hypothetical protein